jgi:hypothetical protein
MPQRFSPWSARRAGGAIVLAIVANLGFAALVMATASGPDYVTVTSWSASAQNANRVRLTATTDGTIPKRPESFINANAIVGLAWADLGTGTAVVATIHPVIGRDSNQRPDAWHVHTVQLAGGATAPNDFCLVAVLTTPTAGINIQGSTMSLAMSASDMPDPGSGPIAVAAIDAAVGFTVHGDDACGSGLGVRLRV